MSRITATAAPTPTAMPPPAPFSPCVSAQLADVAESENDPAVPDHKTPSVTSAFTVLPATSTATEAPTPTLVPLPPPSEGRALVTFVSLLAAPIATLPPPVMLTEVVLANGGLPTPGARPTTASVSLFTTLTATDPATPILPPPAPDVARAMTESLWSTTFWPAFPVPVSTIALPLSASSREVASWKWPPVRSMT